MKNSSISQKLVALDQIRNLILNKDESLQEAMFRAEAQNHWFSLEMQEIALQHMAKEFLEPKKLANFASSFTEGASKKVGLIMAGNIPFVGFHDLLCVYLSGHEAHIKLSSKDSILPKWFLNKLEQFDPNSQRQIQMREQLKGIEAIIATGTDNSARYFDSYFGHLPHIFRNNRNSVAIINGKESPEELYNLGIDIFRYFGLGCRNVSHLAIPKNYDPALFLEAMEPFTSVKNHNNYKNNFDYYLTLYMMKGMKHYASEFLALVESRELASPIGTLYYHQYESRDDLKAFLLENEDKIQCCVSNEGDFPNTVAFGQSQHPRLNDFADNVNTPEFLNNLH